MDSFLIHTPSDREPSIAATVETASDVPDDQSLPSVESSTSITPKRKRITTADATRQHTRKPQGSEPKARTNYTAYPRGPHISGPSLLHPLCRGSHWNGAQAPQ
ncbi:hypothetical protein BGZ61DRAFT_567391 [Ilyonectria robusta]|uniref:uncharacterized protein n=1 Tax=Ilyonectria robusta TaxID=1079257 RepID=UPI001E8D12EB|nr:uncharacterized protein BGZ61DRAFT_567391 [Ilyonectria robusta]KAH8658905.1 hypothetical protein BGZ61DRAFT_567391 [Ilyonectria robusta]